MALSRVLCCSRFGPLAWLLAAVLLHGCSRRRIRRRCPAELQTFGNERNAAVPPSEVTFHERLVFARCVVGEWIKPRRTFVILFGEPDLVTSEEGLIEEQGVVGG